MRRAPASLFLALGGAVAAGPAHASNEAGELPQMIQIAAFAHHTAFTLGDLTVANFLGRAGSRVYGVSELAYGLCTFGIYAPSTRYYGSSTALSIWSVALVAHSAWMLLRPFDDTPRAVSPRSPAAPAPRLSWAPSVFPGPAGPVLGAVAVGRF